jgi:hypothetical protein
MNHRSLLTGNPRRSPLAISASAPTNKVSGLGLDAQRNSVTRYIAEKGGAIIAEFTVQFDTAKNGLTLNPGLRFDHPPSGLFVG